MLDAVPAAICAASPRQAAFRSASISRAACCASRAGPLPAVPLAQADLHGRLPLQRRRFDGFLCALVSEHLDDLRTLFSEAFAVVRAGGRLIFSAFHPELARAGVEANFEHAGIEYRLGANRYAVDEYLDHIYAAGFRRLHWHHYGVDAPLIEAIPAASKYRSRPLLLVVEAKRPGTDAA